MKTDKRLLGRLCWVVAALLICSTLIHGGSCACPTSGSIDLFSAGSNQVFDEDGSITGQTDTLVVRRGNVVTYTCNIRATALVWTGSVVDGTDIVFVSSVMPGDAEAEGQAQGGAVIATLTEVDSDCRTSILTVNTTDFPMSKTVVCNDMDLTPLLAQDLFVTRHPPPPSCVAVTTDTCSTVLLEWTEPDNSDLPIQNYTISVTDLDNSSVRPPMTVVGSSTTLTTLTEGVNYVVEIVSNDVIGPGDPTDPALQFVIDILMQPFDVHYSLDCVSRTRAQLTWQLPAQGPLTPPPTAVRVCWRENEGVEQCSPNLPPGTIMYTLTTSPKSNYSVRVELHNGCSSTSASADSMFVAAVIQEAIVTLTGIGTVAFDLEFAQCTGDTSSWDVEVSYESSSDTCPGDSRIFSYPVDLTQRVVFNDVTCARNNTFSITVTDGSGTQIGDSIMIDVIPLPVVACDASVLGIVNSATDPECSGLLGGSISSVTIPNGVVCYNGTTRLESDALYICDDGYELLIPEGATNPRECQADGMWSGSDITCVEMACDASVLGIVDSATDPECSGLLGGSISSATIPNGVVCYNGTTRLESDALYICDDGYELLIPEGATNPRECQVDGMWSGSDITCVEMACDASVLGIVDSATDPECSGLLGGSISSATIPNGVVCYNGTTRLESDALYICDDGYELLIPEGATNPRECQVDGMWSGSDITCVEIAVASSADSRCTERFGESAQSADIDHGVICFNGSEALFIANDGCALMPYGTSGQQTCTLEESGEHTCDDIQIGLKVWHLALDVVGGVYVVVAIIITAVMLFVMCRQEIKKWHHALIVINIVILIKAIAYWITGVVISATNCENATAWVAVGFSLSCLSLIYSVAVLIFFIRRVKNNEPQAGGEKSATNEVEMNSKPPKAGEE